MSELPIIKPISMKILVSVDNRIIGCKYDRTEVEDGWILCDGFPSNFLEEPRNWLYINGEFVKEPQEDIDKREEKERFYADTLDTSDARKMELLLSSIPTLPKPADRPGYLWRMIYNEEGHAFGWEEVADPYYEPQHSGTYTDPIPYEVGDSVTKYTNPDPFTGDGWYTYDGDVKVCIKSGTPLGFDDTEYFAYDIP